MRSVNRDRFEKCIYLRKQGLSYTEIMVQVKVAKSTLQNWLTDAGLTLTKEHFEIQAAKRFENYRLYGVEASRRIREERSKEKINQFIEEYKKFIEEPQFVMGVIAYHAEGSKSIKCSFSNSDYRLIQLFINFMVRYFNIDRLKNITYGLYVHEIRKDDLDRIKCYWASKLTIPKNVFRLTWKKNVVTVKRFNLNYVGQMNVNIKGEHLLFRKLLAISDIIMRQYCGVG